MLGLLTDGGLCLGSFAIQLAYPMFKTWETMSTNNPSKQWLSYWVIYSFLLLIESLTFNFSCCTFTLIPKLLFCLWLIHPDFLGASFLHETVLDQGFTLVDQIVGPYLKPLLNKKEKSE